MSDMDENGYALYGYMDGKQGTFILNLMGVALVSMFLTPIVLSFFIVH